MLLLPAEKFRVGELVSGWYKVQLSLHSTEGPVGSSWCCVLGNIKEKPWLKGKALIAWK